MHNEGSDRQRSPKEISLGNEFAGVTLKRSETGALTIDVSALNGVDVAVITSGNVTSRSPVREQANEPGVINASVDKRAYNIGDLLPDGWVVGPAAPETGIVMAIEPVSGALKGRKTWYQGQDHAAELRGQGHLFARQPLDKELNALYNDVVKAGRNDHAKFNTSGGVPFDGYWSSTPLDPFNPDCARLQYFGDGYRHADFKEGVAGARVRCVRDEPGLTLA